VLQEPIFVLGSPTECDSQMASMLHIQTLTWLPACSCLQQVHPTPTALPQELPLPPINTAACMTCSGRIRHGRTKLCCRLQPGSQNRGAMGLQQSSGHGCCEWTCRKLALATGGPPLSQVRWNRGMGRS
jgi:hypothetical protein